MCAACIIGVMYGNKYLHAIVKHFAWCPKQRHAVRSVGDTTWDVYYNYIFYELVSG